MTQKQRDELWQRFLKETNDPAVDKYETWLETRIAELEKERDTNWCISSDQYISELTMLRGRIAELKADVFAGNRVIEGDARLVQEQLEKIRQQQAHIAELEDNIRQAHAFLCRGAYDGDGWIARGILERLLPKENEG